MVASICFTCVLSPEESILQAGNKDDIVEAKPILR